MRPALVVLGVFVLSFLFARVEIEIEGKDGWAGNLPTWRIEAHPLLEILWGGRPLTGYHAWMFAFIILFFHFPLLFDARWSTKLEVRVLACFVTFWILEDFLWFVLNPAFGLRKFRPRNVPWHKNWLLGAPTEYWLFGVPAALAYWYSFLP